MASRTVTLPKSTDSAFASDESYDASDIELPYELRAWQDTVGENMLNNTGRVVNEYNAVARKTWDAIEKLAKIKVEISKYESCSGTIEELRRKAEGG